MKLKLLIIILSLVIFTGVYSEDTIPFTITYSDNPAPGYLLMEPYQEGVLYLVDNSGIPVYQKFVISDPKILNPKLQPNGLISFFANNKIYLVNKNYELVDSFVSVGGYDVDFHDFLILPNGNAVLLSNEKRIIHLGQSLEKEVIVTGSVIQVFGEKKRILFQWKSLDYYDIKDVVPPIDTTQSSLVVSNLNSMHYDADGNFILSNRAYDEVTKIDSKTGKIIWRLGGKECKNNQFRYLNDTINGFYGFSHQHSVTRLQNGNLLMYDNGNLKPNPYSRAVEFKIDEINKTIEKVWEYSDFPEIYSQSMGSAERLPNGNTLIGWGLNQQNKTATEMKPDGTKALEIVGLRSYAVYKVVYKMDAFLHYVDSTGDYDFNDSIYRTNIKLNINSLAGKGSISVEKHYYQPHNPEFSDKQPYSLFDNRWVLSQSGIDNIDASVRFYTDIDSDFVDDEYNLYYREYEGKGIFSPLPKVYNKEERYFETNIKGFGEFVIGLLPSISPPVGLSPVDGAVDVPALSSLVWQVSTLVSSYRVQVSTTPDFSNIITDTSGLTDNWLYLYFDNNTKYYWRVKAYYEDKQSPWSLSLSFTTVPVAGIGEKLGNSNISVYQRGDRLVMTFNDSPGIINVSLYDIYGNQVKKARRKYLYNKNQYEMKIGNLDNGVYIYRIIKSDEINFGKVFIEK